MGVKNWQTSLSYLTQKGDAVVARLEHLAHNLFEHLVGMMTRGHGRVSQSLPSSLRVARSTRAACPSRNSSVSPGTRMNVPVAYSPAMISAASHSGNAVSIQ